MIITRSVDPTQEPVTLEEVKEFLNITFNDKDKVLNSLITAAARNIEAYVHRSLVEQTWKYYLQGWPSGNEIKLPYPPLQSVTSVKYTDSDDSQTTWSSSSYEVDTDAEPGRIILAYGETWPSTTLSPKNPIEIEYVAGYDGDGESPEDLAANIPESIKIAIKFDIEMHYARSSESFINKLMSTRDALLFPYRVWTFAT